MRRTPRCLVPALLCLTLVTGGCGPKEDTAARRAREGYLIINNAAEPSGLDPQEVTGLLESRIVYCMTTLQGIKREDATRRVFGGPGAPADMEALVAYVTAESRGAKMDVPLSHPKERAAYAMGEKLFFYRSGPYDFACSTCHGDEGKRIRLQDLPNLTKKADVQRAYSTWPAYRVSQGELRSFQWRLNDCFRQQRFPELVFGSEASVALTT